MSASTSKTIAPYGSWDAAFTPEMLVRGSLRLREPRPDGRDVYWLEGRPTEGGRTTLIRLRDGATQEITPGEWDVRSRVHEYGGGAYDACQGIVVFSNGRDNRLYRLGPDDAAPAPITPEGPWRYADLVIDPLHQRVIAVREDHALEDVEPINTIVQVDLTGATNDGGQVIIGGTDFVASPALAPDGTRLSWIQWNHPNMPWDGTELWYADLAADGSLGDIRHVTGSSNESIVRPRWNVTGLPVFVSDKTGWWNLYADRGDRGIAPLHPAEAEFTAPFWQFGQSSWDFAADGTVICSWVTDGEWKIGHLSTEGGEIRCYDVPFTDIDEVRVAQETNTVLFVGSSPTDPGGVVALDIDTGAWRFLQRSTETAFDPATISIAQPISWTSIDGSLAYGLYYAPTNPRFQAPEGERPPLIVESHGGPTSMSTSAFSLKRQFWTSRGFAVLDVNYGGSTGYGRPYRDRLKGAWGIVDVQDCVTGAEHLANQGLADPARLAIHGGSAGGFTTLACLTTSSIFAAGTSYYGVADLRALATDTHKFEARYLDGLIGPWPEAQQRYTDRSPIFHLDRLESAVLLLQGLDDKVVPPNQAHMTADALREKGLPVALVLFEGEGHGFRAAETIIAAAEYELAFYGQVFHFTPAGEIRSLEIENLAS